MPSREYLEAILEKTKEYLPGWLWKQLHQAAMPVAGGKARWREPEEPSFLEKMALTEMRPDKLKDASDDEVRMAWLRLHQWYSAAKKRKESVEDIVNAAVWVLDEFERRGFSYDEDSELVQEAKKLRDVKKAQSIESKLAQLPQEVVVVPNFVCVVGSAAAGKEKPDDIDVLFRADRDESGDNFLVQAQNVWLPIRKVLDPQKKGLLHYIDGPTGPHSSYLPIFDLVLRRKQEIKRQVIKTAYPGYVSDKCLEILRDNIRKLKDEDLRWLARLEADDVIEKDWRALAPEKVATRLIAILAAKNLEKRGIVEFFAGEHQLTRIYKHYTDKVVTVDKVGNQDYVMDNKKLIEKYGSEHNNAAIYDFDDQGVCGSLILKWLKEAKPTLPFVITYTYGLDAFKYGALMNTWEKMRIGSNRVRQIKAGGEYYWKATEIAEKSVQNIIKEAGYRGTPLIALRRSSVASRGGSKAGSATYGTWLVEGRA